MNKSDSGEKDFVDIIEKITNVGASFDLGYIYDTGLIHDMELNLKTEIDTLNRYMILKAGPRRITEKCF